MHEYQLIEFSSSKKEIQLVSNQSNLQQVLLELYKEKFEKMFDEDGCSKGYISVFVNSKQITSVKEIALNPNDEICIVTSISGG
ncbi:TPA: MoaD/ThiS family protein [Legionella pneumophila]|uniref:MoaD/ThiS family protein n=1 Tax=Legionella pneumophila TaxID=446 RepID=UPI000875C22F|nr:MoaD/ThiS family protein [Legionella pneumophila]AOW53826.1 molybdopterin converting factor 2 (subunit 1) [Legionella pneumophila subsp. pneumophila]AOW56749.1 molybdopterin converting factor 2 (subunit 1) [Legionella pneumophila subsp. pneumophila]AOW65446.1 molybdopterin converting factor 2 (subunit 1) [Legionella pneumophila subsp. pneumophila]HAT1704490.1 MoaD/ThiS family protein [Legionella pneumophila]HAT4482126.1 MoaD/ThiS family protein [Legionella pneumophila]